ncbi:unnamed protein product [Blepharisma stoltei]|uniref:Uncharacterized protein n=1 Tax=Blepharisma stoltei TaxID=1481888 RepID=A0AAU9IPF7_9CILI|nr:unnamed protein product [Blepharisma stoltei]
MDRKRQRKFQGMQWIFLKSEKLQPKNNMSMIDSILSQLEENFDDDFEEITNFSSSNFQAKDTSRAKINETSIRDKYTLAHIDDVPSKLYKNPHIELEEIENSSNFEQKPFHNLSFTSKPKIKKKYLHSSSHERPKTMEIRKVIIPPKQIPRIPQVGQDTPFNRRKSYGKWFLRPQEWNNSLHYFLEHSTKKNNSFRMKSQEIYKMSV